MGLGRSTCLRFRGFIFCSKSKLSVSNFKFFKISLQSLLIVIYGVLNKIMSIFYIFNIILYCILYTCIHVFYL